MNILFYNGHNQTREWCLWLKAQLPEAHIFLDETFDNRVSIDYAIIWRPTPITLLHLSQCASLKALFLLGAGVDSFLTMMGNPSFLLPKVPIYRLHDAGMAIQMKEYATAMVLRYYRRFDEYQHLQNSAQWTYLPPHRYDDFIIGVMGIGVLGEAVARQLACLGFKVKGWGRRLKFIDQVETYSEDQLPAFLANTRLIINLLPSTPKTRGILNHALFNQLRPKSYLINIARGDQVVEDDLLIALSTTQLQAATLDVFSSEPLSPDHLFWQHPNITITPHSAASKNSHLAVAQIVEKIHLIEQHKIVSEGLVNLNLGY